jgi:Flp pilus assembly protein TadG
MHGLRNFVRTTELAGIKVPAYFRQDEGVAAIEFAIVAPVFLAMLFGIIVYGIYFATWIAVTEAASEGARAAVAGLSTTERTSLATAQVQKFIGYYSPMLNIKNATIVAQQAPGTGGGAFQVQITYNFSSYGLSTLSAFLPIPSANPSVTITVSNGG